MPFPVRCARASAARRRGRRVPLLSAALIGGALAIAGCGTSDSSSVAASAAASAAAAASTTTATTSAGGLPAGGVTVAADCGVNVHVDKPPTHAVTMNQAATEVMLTLGLQGSMAGTAYLDDSVEPSLRAAYASVPVLSKEYPSHEKLLAARPDFVYGVYASAFDPDAAGNRSELAKLGVESYLSREGCRDASQQPKHVRFSDVFGEIDEIGAIFGVRPKADAVVAAMRAKIRRAVGTTPPGTGVSVFWFDSDTRSPYTGACCGAPAMLMRAVGAKNAFADLSGSWATGNWETIVKRDPDVIVLADASWDTAASKEKYLESSPATKQMDAVKHHRFVVIPFSDSTAGVRNADGVQLLADGLRRLGFGAGA